MIHKLVKEIKLDAKATLKSTWAIGLGQKFYPQQIFQQVSTSPERGHTRTYPWCSAQQAFGNYLIDG